MDRGYLDFACLYRRHKAGAFFVTRLKSNTCFYVIESRPIADLEVKEGLRCDQTIKLNFFVCKKDSPDTLRRISYVNLETGNDLVFITNQFELAALIVAQIYRRRWAIERFFRWIKQHLQLCGFYSTSFNGVSVQIWSANCAYPLIAIAKRRKQLPQSLGETLQIASIASTQQIPIHE